MQKTSKKAGFIIICTIVTFLITNIFCVLLEFVQTWLILEILFHLYILLLLFNNFLVVSEYFFVKRLIERYSKQEYTDLRWALIKLDIILTQSAGVITAFPVALCINKRYFLGMYGGMGSFCVEAGMCLPLTVMFLAIFIKDLCPGIKMIPRRKKEKSAMTENRGMTVILVFLAVFMYALTFEGFLLGREMTRMPSMQEFIQKKAEYIIKNKEYIEKIREYIESLNYEELAACGEQEIKVGSLNAEYKKENDYCSLILQTQEIMEAIGLKDKDIVASEGRIRVEFDTGTYKIRKIVIEIEDEWSGFGPQRPTGLAWYSPDYGDRAFIWAVLDDNWQIEYWQ